MKLHHAVTTTGVLALTALAVPALVTTGAQAGVTKASKSAGCSVSVLPSSDGQVAQGGVIKSVAVANDPTNPENLGNLGYFADTTTYDGSAALTSNLDLLAPVGGCGSVSVSVFAVRGGAAVPGAVETRTVQLSSSSPTSLEVTNLVAGLPADNDGNEAGLCLGAQVEVRDSNGTVVQLAPSNGPALACPDGGGGFTYGG